MLVQRVGKDFFEVLVGWAELLLAGHLHSVMSPGAGDAGQSQRAVGHLPASCAGR